MSVTGNRLRELLRYDPDTGVFTRAVDVLMPRGGVRNRAGSPAGADDGLGYVRIRVDGKKYKAHRLAFLYMTDTWPSGEVDHINGVRNDNRWSNLRDATRSINQQNQRGPTIRNVSGAMGVCNKRWGYTAQITVNNKHIYLGYFKTAEAANAAYLEAKRKLHEGCTL
jgi:hypothetical protein